MTISFDPYSPLALLGEQQSANDRNTIANNFDTFLTLLTTQLQNQNPVDPLDTNQFTSQLVEFASVEQAIKQNENLENLARLSAANAITGAVSFIGKQVSASGNRSELHDGQASWTYSLNDSAAQATFSVLDANGSEVYSQSVTNPAQDGVFSWNGIKTDGSAAAEGSYTISVSAEAADGSAVTAATHFSGRVSQVDLEGGVPVLTVAGRAVKLEDIVRVLESTQTGS